MQRAVRAVLFHQRAKRRAVRAVLLPQYAVRAVLLLQRAVRAVLLTQRAVRCAAVPLPRLDRPPSAAFVRSAAEGRPTQVSPARREVDLTHLILQQHDG